MEAVGLCFSEVHEKWAGSGTYIYMWTCILRTKRVKNVDRYFERQMEAAEATKLPLFLHCRNSAQDFMEIISRNRDKISGGVVSH